MSALALLRVCCLSLILALPGAGVAAAGAQSEGAEAERQAGLDALRAGRFADAVDAYQRAVARDPTREQLYLELADVFLGAGLAGDAEDVLRSARTRFPESRSANYNLLFFDLAELYVSLGRIGSAESAMSEASRVPGPRPESLVWRRLGDFSTDLLHFDAAEAAYETALESDPDDGATRVALGNLYLRRNELDRAMSYFTGLLDAGWDGPDIHHGIAEVHWRRGEWEQAVFAADRVLRAAPDYRRALYIRGSALVRLGSRESGRASLEEYRRLDGIAHAQEHRVREIRSIRAAGMDLVRGRRYEDAITAFRRGIDVYPLSDELYLGLGLAQSEAGLHQDAVATFRQWLDLGLKNSNIAYEHLVRESGLLPVETEHQGQ